MINVGPFEDEIGLLKKTYEHDFYEYENPSDSFKACTNSHFNKIKQKERYGVYIVRHRDTQEVLYVGKGGTIDSQGKFKRQNILKRLRNVKEGNISADKWFRNLLQEKGPLIIEYIFLSTSKSPALIEVVLLQAYLNEYHRLPYKNKSL